MKIRKYKKTYVRDYRKLIFDCIHIDNNLSIEQSIKELRGLTTEMRCYLYVFEFTGKKIKSTIYENRRLVNLNELCVNDRIAFFEFQRKYKNYLQEIGVIKG